MSYNPEILSIVTGVLGILLTLLSSFPAARQLHQRWVQEILPICPETASQRGKPEYQDEDGEATDCSIHQCTDTWQKLLISILSVTGLEISLALAIVTVQSVSSPFVIPFWLEAGGWIVLCLQSVAFFTESSIASRYVLGVYAFGSSFVTAIVPCIQFSLFWAAGVSIRMDRASTGLFVSHIIIATLRAICCVLIPRRPNVYHEGQVVDQEKTASLYSRLTYGWANGVLRHAARSKYLAVNDLPKLPYVARAASLHIRFEQALGSRKLWKALLTVHAKPLTMQACLSLVTCILGFGPQVAMYSILKSLEDRSLAPDSGTAPWIWVVGLGSVLILSLGIESWLWWIIYSQIWIPIYEGLTALVFAKAMRCKEVKQVKNSTPEKERNGDDDDDDDEEDRKGRQSVINLASVDSKRIADFATFNYLIPSCIIRLALAAGFLLHLIGWRSLLAGVSMLFLLMPANTWLTTRYAAAQQELMKATDKRSAAVTEVLQGIRQIKFAALEKQWKDRITDRRRVELGLLWRTSLYTTGMVSVWVLGPLMLSAASLTVYALHYGELSASVAFTALSVFGNLESAMASLPDLMSKGMEAKVSTDRIDKYLGTIEKQPHTTDVNQISFDDATVAWPAEERTEGGCEQDNDGRFKLRNLTLSFPPKALSVIAGKTGSGKSLLLASILGESDTLSGVVSVPHSPLPDERYDHRVAKENWILDSAVAYVSQNPWMENATIRDNILFGLPYNWSRYRKVLFASGLEKDLKILPDGELTDIGSNGINLSGGQRWRISFARALYSRAGILIMDDIFSALDAETGRHLYEHALTGELGKGRTRILVTHHVGLCLPRTDYCVFLDNGCMTHAGTVEQLTNTPELAELLRGLNTEIESQDRKVIQDEVRSRRKRSSAPSPTTANNIHIPKKFTQAEKRETGSISMRVYAAYLSRGSSLLSWIITFVAYGLFMALLIGRSWWVRVWTASSESTGVSSVWNQIRDTSVDRDLVFYLTIYIALSFAACVLGSLRYLAISLASLQSSRQLFEDLLTRVLHAPLRWLDTVPLGRVLNRFTSDVYILDWRLGYDMGHFLYKILELSGVLVAGVLVSPVILALGVALIALCYQIARLYLAGVREVKRLESIAKSPVMEQFGTSLAGLMTIRAFNKVDIYIRQMYAQIDRHAQTAWYLWLFNRWLALRMSVVGAIFSTGTAALVSYSPGMSAALAGFAVTFALQYNYAVSMGLRFYADLEMDMTATERVLEYTDIDIEDQDGYEPPASWPLRGRVEVEDLVVGYAPDLPPVLNGLSFTLEHNQRVGVVGRTGAGKSSLTLALFRFLEARTGRIVVDGLDVSKMKLHALRSRLAIIPQDPVLFSGTVRSNLDPFNEYTDLELYNALERVHLLSFEDTLTLGSQSSHEPLSGSDTVGSSASSTAGPAKLPGFFASLSSPISEGGLNLSQGQRQLLCLARAIVSHPKIMILDEATSAVDMETDAMIQRSIRAEFGRNASSLLVIAHRLSTIADFDRILVMDAGRAVEFGTPQELMRVQGGVFRNLVENSGEKAVLEEMILGTGERQ
ncbi:P-loop containing nucleoside triphosphate hydrolase protein [Aspergillus ambiguus]|uniref:P-loop containing nucleoside triphosphate hydrolase protein n=1 Tax=Aspergillus ambiguus TaxID=176160 RepID=UPI003CCD124F